MTRAIFGKSSCIQFLTVLWLTPDSNIPTRKEVWSCARDEGRPLASGDQEPDANRCKLLLPLRAVVVSVAEKAGPDPAVVCRGETSESKPSMNGRKGNVDVETEVGGH